MAENEWTPELRAELHMAVARLNAMIKVARLEEELAAARAVAAGLAIDLAEITAAAKPLVLPGEPHQNIRVEGVGMISLHPSQIRALYDNQTRQAQRHLHLTASETRIAHLYADGQGCAQIATGLEISAKTVENHLTHIRTKLRILLRRDTIAHNETRALLYELGFGAQK